MFVGKVSYRNPGNGTWFIRALVVTFYLHAHDTHLEDLFKMVMMNISLVSPNCLTR